MKPLCLPSISPLAQVNPLPGEERAEVLPQHRLGARRFRLLYVPSTLGQVSLPSCPSILLLETQTATAAKEQ